MTSEQPYCTNGFFPLANFIHSYQQRTGEGWARVINQFEQWTRRPDLYLSVRPPLLRSGPEAIFCSRAVTCDFCYYSGRTSIRLGTITRTSPRRFAMKNSQGAKSGGACVYFLKGDSLLKNKAIR